MNFICIIQNVCSNEKLYLQAYRDLLWTISSTTMMFYASACPENYLILLRTEPTGLKKISLVSLDNRQEDEFSKFCEYYLHGYIDNHQENNVYENLFVSRVREVHGFRKNPPPTAYQFKQLDLGQEIEKLNANYLSKVEAVYGWVKKLEAFV